MELKNLSSFFVENSKEPKWLVSQNNRDFWALGSIACKRDVVQRMRHNEWDGVRVKQKNVIKRAEAQSKMLSKYQIGFKDYYEAGEKHEKFTGS
ncbi:unnamed protein product [Sphenostylis stenocarpa]|uniref:Uncharacterized protein n=1 Tax=Sphenostylis stenocarpa TaxID=92480 RepID=A0AA86SZ07_9FABA|nr:unnamed protein product [Sphenostylis stenocarpa]